MRQLCAYQMYCSVSDVTDTSHVLMAPTHQRSDALCLEPTQNRRQVNQSTVCRLLQSGSTRTQKNTRRVHKYCCGGVNRGGISSKKEKRKKKKEKKKGKKKKKGKEETVSEYRVLLYFSLCSCDFPARVLCCSVSDVTTVHKGTRMEGTSLESIRLLSRSVHSALKTQKNSWMLTILSQRKCVVFPSQHHLNKDCAR